MTRIATGRIPPELADQMTPAV
ncbi:MAG: hypothetical protein JWO38_7383, partial [Gemmataceae bacterium]|nr:hypothetical protein [Gemmataceae bacterium]